MGKSLNGKELGKGLSQRKDGLYQARFVNRFGVRQTIYAPKLNEVRKKLREEQYRDEKEINVVDTKITLDEWYTTWMTTCKCNCRDSTKRTYETYYNRIKADLGWRKLSTLNLITIQNAFNKLSTDAARKDSKRVLVDMLDKAVDSDLLIKNVAKQVNTVVSKEEPKERRVLTIPETELFLKQADGTFYYNMYVLALETGMRIGELCGLMWSDIDFSKNVLYVKHNLCYFSKNGKYVFEMHDTKTKSGVRTIPLTQKAVKVLNSQKLQKQKIVSKGKTAESEYCDLVFVTKNNKPTQQFIVQECMELIIKNIQINHPEFERFTPHTFRHSFATRAIENGMQPKTLSKILGHKTLQMTMDRYCHVTDDTLFSEMKKMESSLP
ncbi:MAG: site-specific integrase [Lachnospiraceae bacterium]|nr:site-specific integrase [Lachnospiraceae bacterium]